LNIDRLIEQVENLPLGLSFGTFNGRRYSISSEISSGRRRIKFFGENLGGTDFVSFNAYKTASKGWTLKPCEMSSQKIFEFIEKFIPDGDDQVSR
jgi:hypothetical protein